MSKKTAKKHFAELCECIWNKIEGEEKLDAEAAGSMRRNVAKFAMTAWNMSLAYSSPDVLEKALKEFAEANDEGSPRALNLLMEAAELKGSKYRKDTDFIVKADVETVNGKPYAVAYLKGELPDIDQEQPAAADDECEGQSVERDYSITRDKLDSVYELIQKQVPQNQKKAELKKLLVIQTLLAPLCKKAYQGRLTPMTFPGIDKLPFTVNTIPDMILTLAVVYLADVKHLMEYDKETHSQLAEIAKKMVDSFMEDRDQFDKILTSFDDPEMFAFIAETLDKFNLSPMDFKDKLTVLIIWGFMIEEARKVQHQDRYTDAEDDNPEMERYDFARQKTLRLFYLHVKLRRYRVSVNLTAPEDVTFAQLHTILNSVFERDDDHLYCFECDDGCTAVRGEREALDDGAVLSSKCYLGHHLTIGSKVYYLFDYGDQWEHDITVKKVVEVEPKDCHFEILKINGTIPKQYPDWDEEE